LDNYGGRISSIHKNLSFKGGPQMYDIGETPESLKTSAFGLKGSTTTKEADNQLM